MGCLIFLYELLVIRLDSFIGCGRGVRFSPKSNSALIKMYIPRIEINKPMILQKVFIEITKLCIFG